MEVLKERESLQKKEAERIEVKKKIKEYTQLHRIWEDLKRTL